MIVKIVTNSSGSTTKASWEAKLYEADAVTVHKAISAGEVDQALSDNDQDVEYLIGPKYEYGPEEPRRAFEPEIVLHLEKGGDITEVVIMGMCTVYVMNDDGKTVDRFSNK